MKKILLLIPLLLLACGACSPQKQAPAGRIKVVTTIFPLYDFARQIAGDRAEVTMLIPPGVEVHSYEPRPEDMLTLHDARLFVFTGGTLEPWAASLAKGAENPNLATVEATKGIPLVQGDPHVWLDPDLAGRMAENIAAALEAADPGNASWYASRCATYVKKLRDLDADFRAGLASCRTRTLLHGGHFAFGYLARRYGIDYHAAYPAAADAEPTAAQMAEMVRLVQQKGVHYLFYEETVSPRVAETLARETGAKLLMLNGAHTVTRDDLGRGTDFLTIMRRNLANLKVGLECR